MNKQNHGQGKRTDFPRLLSGYLCLDFVNTIDGRQGAKPVEFLNSYAELIAWAEHVWMLDEEQVGDLLERAARSPAAAAGHFAQAVALREALYRMFRAVVHQQRWRSDDEQQLKRVYRDAIGLAELRQTDLGFRWQWSEQHAGLDLIAWNVAQSAIELLGSARLDRVKECPGADDCGWLFFDASKNGTRRWCSMESCGSRVKMRRQYARKRGE